MNLKLVALLLILPLLTLAIVSVQEASANSGDGKSCSSKHKDTTNSSYWKSYSKTSLDKLSKKSF